MNTESDLHSSPQLAPPGAGLPWPQLLFLRFWMGPVTARRTPRAQTRERYELLTQKIISLVSATPVEARRIRVLVDPIAGLEDSSRHWSLNGVLEHLLIVSKNIEDVILTLSSGSMPAGVADTARVKPQNMVEDRLADFVDYAPELIQRLDRKLAEPSRNFESPLKFRHPWFGGFTAKQWYWLLAGHQAIHYQQVKGITQKLKANKTAVKT